MQKNRKWYACMMDEGVIASGNTVKEILEKFYRNSAKYVEKGHYEFKDGNSQHGWTVWILHRDIMKYHGFDPNYDHNTWYIDEQFNKEEI